MDWRLLAYDFGVGCSLIQQSAEACCRLANGPLDDGLLPKYVRMDLKLLQHAQRRLRLGESVSSGIKSLSVLCQQLEQVAKQDEEEDTKVNPWQGDLERLVQDVEVALASRVSLGSWFRVSLGLGFIVSHSLNDHLPGCESGVELTRAAAEKLLASKIVPKPLTKVIAALSSSCPIGTNTARGIRQWLQMVENSFQDADVPSVSVPEVPILTCWLGTHAFDIMGRMRTVLKDVPPPPILEVIEWRGAWTAILNFYPYALTDYQAYILKALLEVPGAYLPEQAICAKYPQLEDVRFNRELKKMHVDLRQLIDARKGHGGGRRLNLEIARQHCASA